LIFLAIFVAVMLFLLLGVTISVLGVSGASASFFIQNKTVKTLLLIASLIVSFVGLLCLLPFIVAILNLPSIILPIGMVILSICAGISAIAGIKLSAPVQNKIGRIILQVIFYILLISAIILVIFTLLASCILLSAA